MDCLGSNAMVILNLIFGNEKKRKIRLPNRNRLIGEDIVVVWKRNCNFLSAMYCMHSPHQLDDIKKAKRKRVV